MKKYIAIILISAGFFVACDNKDSTTKTAKTSKDSIKLPYEAGYATEFTNEVSDSNLLMVLNTYKYWENNDMKSMRNTMGDSMEIMGADGFKFKGRTDSLMKIWTASRDSIVSAVITMDVWLKNHSVKDSMDYVNVWYKEIDTFKSGKVDSANYEDDNGIKNGKIVWFSSHKQKLK